MRLLALLGALCVVPSLAAAQRHHADPRDTQARELFDQGSASYEEGRYEEAISAFEEAYSLSARPLLLFNIANAQERLGRLVDALDNLRLYLEDAPGDERPVLERRIRQLEQRVEQQQAEARQRADDTQSIADRAANAAADRVAGRQGHEPPGHPTDPLPWVALIGGGTLAVLAAIFGGLALSARGDLSSAGDATHPPLCVAAASGSYCTAAANGSLSNDSLFSVLTDVTAVLAIAGITTGIVLLVTHHDPAERSSSTVALAPHPGGAELVWSGSL